jgi:hypothetical protein
MPRDALWISRQAREAAKKTVSALTGGCVMPLPDAFQGSEYAM